MLVVKTTVDPMGKYPNASGEQIFLACGQVPVWLNDLNNPDHESIKSIFSRFYVFGVFETKGGIVDEEGVYKYPNDPDLYPLIKMERGNEIVYQYRSGLVSIIDVETGNSFVTRMD